MELLHGFLGRILTGGMMGKSIKVTTKRSIGADNPVFIIAEIGSNHNRDFNTALKLIDAAALSGVDAVKFQLFEAERHYSRYTPKFSGMDKHIINILQELELPRQWK